MVIRRFSAKQLELCEQWFGEVLTADEWKDCGPVGEGESQSRHVENQSGLRGVAKPGVLKNDNICRAAHEKIAFDLAHALGLPVPPVVLWDRGENSPGHRYTSVSAWAFPNTMKWDPAQQKGLISEASRASAGPALSTMRVFHTWISDTDRKSDHTQIDLDSPEGELGVAFIDHAYSMSHVWKSPSWKVEACPKYMPAPEVMEVMMKTAERIAAFPEVLVKEVVNRIPAGFLPDVPRGHIISNLLSRRACLRAPLSIPEGEDQ